MSFPLLFQPGKIGKLTLRNRVLMSLYPTRYSQESAVTPRIIEFFRARAQGGVALIVIEAPSIDYPQDYKGGRQLRLDEVQFTAGLEQLIKTVHQEGALAFMQLTYPEAKPASPDKLLVNELSPEEFHRIAQRFAQAAQRLQDLGCDGVEVQAGYGELLASFLSPASNHRQDSYGGSLENRARFPQEVLASVRRTVGQDFPIQVKMSAQEYIPNGFTLEEAKEVAPLWQASGASSLLVSAGTRQTRRWSIPPQASPPGPLVPFAAAVKEKVSIPVVAMGKVKHPSLAEAILSKGKADFIALTRELIADPDWPRKAQEGRPEDIRGCIFCLQDCSGDGVPGLGRACTVNPYAGQEAKVPSGPTSHPRRIWVVGGGPAGMAAAIAATERGHQVELWERAERLGGIFTLSHIAPYKGDVAELPRYLEHRLRQLSISLHLGREVTAAQIAQEPPEVVIVATGSLPSLPPIPGSDGANVVNARQIWAGKAQTGARVAIIGGGSTGCETAEMLADRGCWVWVLEMLPEVLGEMKPIPRGELLGRLQQKGVGIKTKARVEKIEREQLLYREQGGELLSLSVDTVVLGAGAKPERTLAQELEKRGIEHHLVGDCLQPSNGGSAIRGGTFLGLSL